MEILGGRDGKDGDFRSNGGKDVNLRKEGGKGW